MVIVLELLDELELAALLELEHRPLFYRCEVRHTRLKRRCDCGCVIDGTEPYRYQVWKMRGGRGVEQRLDCEFCARVDVKS